MAIYSHSRLSTFENCPRKFFYQYVVRIPVEKMEGIEAFLGVLVHEALEKLYRDVMHGRRATHDELIESFRTAWAKKFHGGIEIVKKEYRAADYQEVGVQALRHYHARHFPFDQTATLDLEKRIVVNLDENGQYRLQGYIDRLSRRTDGTIEIHDYKTNARLPTQAEKDEDRQLALYQLGVDCLWDGIDRIELVWHFLRFDQEIRSERNPGQLEKLRRQTISLIDDIEGRGREESAFEPRESSLCNWCPFQHVCPVRKHLFKTAELPANEFSKEPGVKLVNQWATVRNEIKEHKNAMAALEDRQNRIIEVILDLAQRENITVITGSDHEAVVASKTAMHLPTKGHEAEAHAELEQCLRKSADWPAVSMLDAPRLRRIWKGDEDDPGGVRQLLEPFVREVTSMEAKLRPRKE